MLDWLNYNSSAVNALLTAAIAVWTAVYAVLTWRLVKETRLTRLTQTEPEISIYLDEGYHLNLFDLVVKNIGRGQAYDVKFEVKEDFNINADSPLSELNIFKHGVESLAPDQSLRFYIANAVERDDLEDAKFVIRTRYANRVGGYTSREFTIRFKHYFGMGRVGLSPERSMAESLQKIEGIVSRIGTPFRRPEVVIRTKRELKKENEAIRAQIAKRESKHGPAPE